MADTTSSPAPAKTDWWAVIEDGLQIAGGVASFTPVGAAVMAVITGLSKAEPIIKNAVLALLSKQDATLEDLVALQATVADYKTSIPKPSDVIAAG